MKEKMPLYQVWGYITILDRKVTQSLIDVCQQCLENRQMMEYLSFSCRLPRLAQHGSKLLSLVNPFSSCITYGNQTSSMQQKKTLQALHQFLTSRGYHHDDHENHDDDKRKKRLPLITVCSSSTIFLLLVYTLQLPIFDNTFTEIAESIRFLSCTPQNFLDLVTEFDHLFTLHKF